MTLSPLRWDDFDMLDEHTEWSEALNVVVEHKYQETLDSKELTALFPARAWIDETSGNLIVEYMHVVANTRLVRRFSYFKSDMPVMYLRSQLLHKIQLALGIGILLLWDKEHDAIVKPGDGRPAQWFMLWKDEPWYTWDNDTQSYSKLWTRGITEQDYEKSFLPEDAERYRQVMGMKKK